MTLTRIHLATGQRFTGHILRRGWRVINLRDMSGDTIEITRAAVAAIESGPTLTRSIASARKAWDEANKERPALSVEERERLLREAGT